MRQRIEHITGKYPWLLALSITLAFFLLLNCFATALLNSDDDAFFMYTLSGGYGEAPTELLHYNYGWHPWLGTIVKKLFVANPSVNWYTVFLSLFHIAGYTATLYVLFKKLRWEIALFFSIVLFCFVEARLLLSFTYTAAAMVAAIGASCLLIYELQQERIRKRNIIFVILLLLGAGMLRLQIVWLVNFIFIPLAITQLRKAQLIKWLSLSTLVVLILFGLNKIQENHYTHAIHNWKAQEKFRQGLFYAYNRQVKDLSATTIFRDSTEQQLFMRGFLYDSVQFTPERVNEISHAITRQRSFASKEDRQGLFWFFIELRIYILLFGTILLGLWVNRQRAVIKKWLLSFLLVLLLQVGLFIFLKITLALYLGLVMILWVSLALHFMRETTLLPSKKWMAIATAILLAALFAWMGIRVSKENSINAARRQAFICALGEINRSSDKLFVATDGSFQLDDFYIWNTPRQYPAKNVLYKERLLTHTYLQTLSRFGIRDLQDALLHNSNVLLLGQPVTIFKTMKMEGPLPIYKCLTVWQLNPVN